jgi:hypothetical protein
MCYGYKGEELSSEFGAALNCQSNRYIFAFPKIVLFNLLMSEAETGDHFELIA